MKKIGLIFYFIVFIICFANIFETKANYIPGAFNSWNMNTQYSTTNMPSGYKRYSVQTSDDEQFKLLMNNSDWNNGWGSGYWFNNWNSVWNVNYTSSGLSNAYVKNFGTNQYMSVVTSISLTGTTSKFGFMKTSASPINISTVSGGVTNVSTGVAVNVSITLSSTKCAEEYILVRYTTNNWSTSSFVTATGSGTNYSATIPSQSSSCTVQWYALTSTLSSPSTDTDYLTLSVNNNSGSNYSYTVINPITVNQLTTGRPISNLYLGDKLSSPYYFNFEIVNQSSWNSSQVGIGQNTDGSTGWSWADANWYQDNGSNKDVRRYLANFQFTNSGTWYVVGRAKTNSGDPWTYADESSSTNETTLTCSTSSGNCPYFTVNTLNNPSSQAATASSTTQINLSWSKDAQNHNVMIVRYPSTTYTAPTNGTSYSLGATIGGGTVVYNSNGMSFSDTGLTMGTTYYYVFYSENYSYYSSGVNANATTFSTLYFRSKANGSWSSTSTWQQSSDNINWSDASSVPTSTANGVTIVSGNSVSISSVASTPTSTNFIVNGTLEIGNSGSVSTAPTYGVNSILKYNTGSGTTPTPGSEWPYNVQSGAVGYPANIEVTTGTLKVGATYDNKYYAGNLTVKNGAVFDVNVPYDSHKTNGLLDHQGAVVVKFDGDITIETGGKVEYAGGTSGGNLAFQCHKMTNNGTLSLSENTSYPLQAIGGDLYLTGDFIENSTFNCNGRALIFTDSENQKIDGTSTQPFLVDFMKIDKSGGVLTTYKDITCKGWSSNSGGWWALEIPNGTLDLNGHSLIISDTDGTGTKGSAGVSCTGTGKIKGSPTSSVTLLGNRSTWSADNNHLVFDQTTPGTTNALKDLVINRTDSASLIDKVYINAVHIYNSLQIKASETTIDAVTLDSAAVSTISSSVSTAKLNITSDMVFVRSLSKSPEFYRNSRTLTIGGTVKTKVHFARIGKWHFVSFPYDVKIKKPDNNPATIGTSTSDGDLAVYVYNPIRRSKNVSGWVQLKGGYDYTLKKDTGYIMAKRGTLEDLTFVPVNNVQGGSDFFTTPRTVAVSYTSATVACNSGWNFVAQPISVSASPSLASGEFAYNYEPSNDQYKLYYYQYNPGYTYSSSNIKPFSSVFVKAASVGSASFTLATPQGVRRKAPSEIQESEEVIPINLNVNNVEYETLVRVMPEATTGQDELYDAPYSTPMSSSTPRLYTLIDGVQYALNSVPEGSTIPVGIRVPAAGTYSFSWTTPTGELQPTLTDTQTSTVTDMTTASNYEFNTTTSGDINSRFVINIPKRVSTNVEVANNKTSYRIYTQNNKITIDGFVSPARVSLFDITGKLMQIRETVSTQIIFDNLRAGVYILQISDNNKNNNLKIVVH
ncbi:hypothetical protein TRIP_D260040 [uncultured Paludibacter sp.]|uniref:Secretion system C-terminal sorting domain-containing protein n=1 Tax=uncultured Paludibacter sp. TaxID=497635 RepID=A0A653A966_9BACT|nr:hypothetical protein TRIP_D260040 [uncultured Paludibacter sp.]